MNYDQAAPLALLAELYTVERLVQCGHLTDNGLHHAFHWLNHSNQMSAAAGGNTAIVRERVLDTVITALADRTGLPRTYWTDRLMVDVPDNPSGLVDGA